MQESGAAGSKAPFQVRTVKQIKPDLAVASVAIGGVTIHAIWVNDIFSTPTVGWPRSGRGWPLISVEDGLRGEIENAILDIVAGWRHA